MSLPCSQWCSIKFFIIWKWRRQCLRNWKKWNRCSSTPLTLYLQVASTVLKTGRTRCYTRVSFLEEQEHIRDAYSQKYDLIFKWIPFMYHQDREACESMLTALSEALMPEGFMFLVGPRQLQGLFDHYKLDALYNDPIYNMPFFRQHLKMCPENQVNPDLVVY